MKFPYTMMACVVVLAGSAFSADAGAQPAVPVATADGAVAQTATGDDWRTMVRKVKQLKDDTGIKGFLAKDPPKYLTEGYLSRRGYAGAEVKISSGCRTGWGRQS